MTTRSAHRRGHRPATPTDALVLLGRLTRRDRHLLELLAEHQVLTTEQIAALLFPSLDAARHRLVTLWRYHALERFRRPGLDGRMTGWRYTLGPAGATVLAHMRATDSPRPNRVRARAARLAAHPHLDHLLGAHDVVIALARHAHRHPDYQLAAWFGEASATAACGRLARPDALGVWTHHTSRVVFCLEHDTGTEPLTRVAAKLTGYADLADAGGPHLTSNPNGEDPGHVGPFTVLIHLHSPAREAALHRLLATNPHTPRRGECWQLATSHTDHPDGPAGPAWLPACGGPRRDLAHLDAR